MEEEKRTTETRAAAPEQDTESRRRLLTAALLTYPLAYLYIDTLFTPGIRVISLVLAVLGYVALTEYLCRGVKRSGESCFLLGNMLLITACYCVSLAFPGVVICRVWDGLKPMLFIHVLVVWWTLSRADRLLEGESGHLIPLDALNGFIRFPLENAFLRISTLVKAAASRRKKERKINGTVLLWSVVSVAAAAALFSAAVMLLRAADSGFDRLLAWMDLNLSMDIDEEVMMRLIASIPAGGLLFALLAGCRRTARERIDGEAEGIRTDLEKMRKLPDAVWTGILYCFSALYLLFFGVQAGYLFGAFIGKVPEGFIVSEYARRGFFELCRTMALNFTLIWLALRISRVRARENRMLRTAVTVIIVQSMLLAAVAFSKIALYISVFGFTPKRLQSAWLVTVLFAGCCFSLYSLHTGRKSAKLWLWFGTATLALLHLM